MAVGRARGAASGPRITLSYANVVSTLALVLAIGGGSALAAGTLVGHSSKPPHHHKPTANLTLNSADKAYISAQIATGHVAFATSAASATNATTATNATNAATATNATNATTATNATHATTADTATSAKIATNVYSAMVRADGSLLGSIPTGATSSRTALGNYSVGFGRSIAGCTISASLAGIAVQLGMISVGVANANTLGVTF